MDSKFWLTFSDLLINLSAGWFGAVIIVPLIIKKPKSKLLPRLINLSLGIVAFAVAYWLRTVV